MDMPVRISQKSCHHSVHSSGVPDLKILNVFVNAFPFKLPGSVDRVNFEVQFFSPASLFLSGTHTALGQSGMTGLAKAFWSSGHLGMGLDIEFVISILSLKMLKRSAVSRA
jgi:hypothetical protein